MPLMPALQALQSRWDLLTGRWAAAQLVLASDRADAAEVLREVRGDELHRIVDGDPWASPAFGGRRPPTLDFGVRDRRTGRMVGVLQATEATQLLPVPASVAAYALDRLGPQLAARTLAVTFFALRAEARKSPASLVLLAELCRQGLTRGYSMASFIAEPSLLSRYLQLGARPLAPMRPSAYGGYRIPLVVLMADRAHLQAVNSPLGVLLRDEPVADGDASLAWLRDFEQRYGRIDTGVAAYDPRQDDDEEPAHALLTRGMTEPQVQALLAGSLTLAANAGDRILARGDGGKVLGVVASGLLHVVIDGRVVAALGRGELFGEIAFVTGEPRSADLVAATPGTQLLQFSPAALAGLPPDTELLLWRNLAWCLARRVVERTPVAAVDPAAGDGADRPPAAP